MKMYSPKKVSTRTGTTMHKVQENLAGPPSPSVLWADICKGKTKCAVLIYCFMIYLAHSDHLHSSTNPSFFWFVFVNDAWYQSKLFMEMQKTKTKKCGISVNLEKKKKYNFELLLFMHLYCLAVYFSPLLLTTVCKCSGILDYCMYYKTLLEVKN